MKIVRVNGQRSLVSKREPEPSQKSTKIKSDATTVVKTPNSIEAAEMLDAWRRKVQEQRNQEARQLETKAVSRNKKQTVVIKKGGCSCCGSRSILQGESACYRCHG